MSDLCALLIELADAVEDGINCRVRYWPVLESTPWAVTHPDLPNVLFMAPTHYQMLKVAKRRGIKAQRRRAAKRRRGW